MISRVAEYFFLVIAAAPFIYYLLVLYSSWRFFWRSKPLMTEAPDFTPPVSILKPLR
jgi:hypothetical protein